MSSGVPRAPHPATRHGDGLTRMHVAPQLEVIGEQPVEGRLVLPLYRFDEFPFQAAEEDCSPGRRDHAPR